MDRYLLYVCIFICKNDICFEKIYKTGVLRKIHEILVEP